MEQQSMIDDAFDFGGGGGAQAGVRPGSGTLFGRRPQTL